MAHSYDSPAHFAQIFGDYLKNGLYSSFNNSEIKNSKNAVSFKEDNIFSTVSFDYIGKTPYMFVKMRLMDEDSVKETKDAKMKMKVKRNRKGKISEYYPRTLERFVSDKIMRFEMEVEERAKQEVK